MLGEFSFTTTYLDSESMEYQVMADDVMYEVKNFWNARYSVVALVYCSWGPAFLPSLFIVRNFNQAETQVNGGLEMPTCVRRFAMGGQTVSQVDTI